MIINAAINEELALGVLKEHLPIKRELFFRALEFFYLNFLPTTINICMFFCHHYHHHHHHHYYFNHHCYFISSYMQKRYF